MCTLISSSTNAKSTPAIWRPFTTDAEDLPIPTPGREIFEAWKPPPEPETEIRSALEHFIWEELSSNRRLTEQHPGWIVECVLGKELWNPFPIKNHAEMEAVEEAIRMDLDKYGLLVSYFKLHKHEDPQKLLKSWFSAESVAGISFTGRRNGRPMASYMIFTALFGAWAKTDDYAGFRKTLRTFLKSSYDTRRRSNKRRIM